MVGEVYGAVQGGRVGGGVEEGEEGGALGWESRLMAQVFLEQPLCACSVVAKKRKKKADKDPALREEHAQKISLCTN